MSYKKTIPLLNILALILVLGACTSNSDVALSTNDFELRLDEKGQIHSLIDRASKTDYAAKDEDNSILSIQVDGEWEQPGSIHYDEVSGIMSIQFPKHDVTASVAIQTNQDYLTFELQELIAQSEVQLVMWGSYSTTIKETIGETIGVVRNKRFAIGIQALNARTLGGYPIDNDDTPSYDIFSTTSLVDIADSLNVLYRGHTALPKDFGSQLQAYTRNRAKDRVIENMNHTHYAVASYDDGGLVGSKIALFGTAPDKVLDIIEKIELNEGLPHPMLNGNWAKRERTATAAYLIQYFSMQNIDNAIALTKKAGLNYLYQGGPFLNWGHFEFKKEGFPDNWVSMKYCVDRAEKAGIKLGVHTLSNFITPNDPYVTPIPDDRLAAVGSSSLINAIDVSAKNIAIADATFFNQMKNNSLHTVKIGEELIRYEKVSEEAPWTLLNCERGTFGTAASSHDKGAVVDKLADHAYKTFLTNSELSIEMAERLADLYNQTGMRQISFDGLEGNHSTGLGSYGEYNFARAWYDQLEPEIKDGYIMDASRSGHFFWHLFTRMNWGEPWYAGFRESQTSYRLLNQDYFRRNYIPAMLGWFNMAATTSIEDIEWMLARSAAFDAGYCLITSPEIIAQNGYGDQILEKVKQWEKARMADAFSRELKKRMENIDDEFSLLAVSNKSWKLIPFKIGRFEHKFRVRQPGEPVWTTFSYENIYEEQPLAFTLNTTNGATVSDITFEIDDFKTINIQASVKSDQYLKYSGGDTMVLYDANWNKLEEFPADAQDWMLNQGVHQFKVNGQFSQGEGSSLKLELKTKGPAQSVTTD